MPHAELKCFVVFWECVLMGLWQIRHTNIYFWLFFVHFDNLKARRECVQKGLKVPHKHWYRIEIMVLLTGNNQRIGKLKSKKLFFESIKTLFKRPILTNQACTHSYNHFNKMKFGVFLSELHIWISFHHTYNEQYDPSHIYVSFGIHCLFFSPFFI